MTCLDKSWRISGVGHKETDFVGKDEGGMVVVWAAKSTCHTQLILY